MNGVTVCILIHWQLSAPVGKSSSIYSCTYNQNHDSTSTTSFVAYLSRRGRQILGPHMRPPTTPGPQASHHLNPALILLICGCWSALASPYKHHKQKIGFHRLAPNAWTDWQDHTFRDHFYSMHLENVIQRWQNPNRDDESQWGFLSMKLAPYKDSSFDCCLVELEECSAYAFCESGGRPRSPSGFSSNCYSQTS